MATPALSFTELESAAKSASAAAAPTTTTEETKTDATTAAVADDKPQFTDTDVAAYRTLQDLGITTANAQDFIQAKNQLAVLAHAFKNDPKALMDELRRTDPVVADRVSEVFSDDWYERKGKYLVNEQPNGGNGSAPRSEPATDPRVDALQREVDALKASKNAEDNAKFQKQVVDNYELALDGLVAKLPADLDPNVKEHIRLKAEKTAWKDDAARARINKGDFTDLPKYFAQASKSVTAETKAAADKERNARAGVETRGSKEMPAGTENTVGATEQKPGQDPIWGNISEAEIAGAYKK